MLRFRTFIVFALLVVALIAAMAGFSTCNDSHEVACETACQCDCHMGPTLAFGNSANVPILPTVQFTFISHSQWLEILLVADVFRPPISA